MIDLILMAIALGAGGGAGDGAGLAVAPATPVAPMIAPPIAGVEAPGTQGLQPEDQTPTGRFTTAGEVKQILTVTKGNWVAVREYDGRDLIYLTHLLSWRCGLYGVKVSINGGPMRDWPLHPCLIDTNAPNAIPPDAKIYEGHPLGSIKSVDVELLYDDLSTDSAHFERKQVLMP